MPSALPLLLVLAAAAPRATTAAYSIQDNLQGSFVWDGVGASFTGASARLLRDYAEPFRTSALDALFSPSAAPSTSASWKGAALQILRLEVGGDANSDGAGSAPAPAHAAGDAPLATRGWAWWLASEAARRNPGVKVMLVPIGWPAFLKAGDPGASSPFADPAGTASFVANSAALFAAQSGATVGYVGLWASPLADVAALAPLVVYAVALRAALDSAGLSGTKIVCADSTRDWNCLAAVDASSPATYNAQLAAVVGVVGNAGRPPNRISGAGVAQPVWVTSAYSAYQGAPQITTAYGAIATSNEWMEIIVNASLGGSSRLPTGFILPFGATGTPYGTPNWHYGLIQANQPASGSWYATVATWAVAAVTQFVPADGSWRLLPAGSGTGNLDLGGYLVSFYAPATREFVIVAQKYYDIAGYQGRTVADESATFELEGALASGSVASVDVWRSCLSTYLDKSDWVLFEHVGSVAVSNNAFTVQLQQGCLYSIANTRPASSAPWLGCADLNCEITPPPPAAAGAQSMSFTDAASCPWEGGPGRLMIDVNGAFECTTDDAALGPCLRQTAVGTPISPFGDTRPHSLTGDLDATDTAISVDVAVSAGNEALLGARISSGTTAVSNPGEMNVARGFWLRIAPRRGAVDWAVVAGLDAGSYGAPVASGSVATGGADLTGTWLTVRLQVRGTRAVGSLVIGGSAVLLFNADASFAPAAGFVGIGTGAFAAAAASFRNLAVSGTGTICDATPAQGAFVTVEVCNDGSAGQAFELVPPPGGLYNASAFSFTKLPKLDASGEDCGPLLSSSDVAGRLAECAANFSAGAAGADGSCVCSGFNGNGYPKARFEDLSPDDGVDLYVLQPPPMQLALSANLSLCVSLGGEDGITLFLDQCAPPASAPPQQLWWFERSIHDGVILSGPLHNGMPNSVVDLWGFGENVGSTVKADGFNKGANQILTHPFPAMRGLIRSTQQGVCLGACRGLS